LTEHNQSKYYIDPYPTQNMDSYNNPYKFNGKEMDRETGMYYYGARYYDPRISIFISIDPLAEEFPNYGGYVYTMNNPINLIDPTGMAPEDTDPPGGKESQELSFKERIALGILRIIDGIGALGSVVNGEEPASLEHNLSYVDEGMMYIADQSLFIYGVNQINRIPSKRSSSVRYSKNRSTSNIAKLVKTTSPNSSRGAVRAAKYSKDWSNASLSEAINKFAPNARGYSTSSGKTIYNNSKTGINVVYDIDGNYFRIENTNITGRRKYLDMNGVIPNNKTVNGKQMGRSQSEYNQVTHFNNID